MERKLATIVRVDEIIRIEGADKIELARIKGWQCVVGKDIFIKEDLGVYFEIDSILPIEQRYEFLRKSCYKKTDLYEGFRIKSMRFKGCLSQGVLIPLVDFPELTEIEVGADVTEKLNVIKYEPYVPPHLQGMAKGNFPHFIPKTDLERCLSEDTEIITENGIKTIKDICENKYCGKILSFNHEKNENEFKNVLSHSVMKNNNDWYLLTTATGKKIIASGNEYFWIENRCCYRRADELTIEDYVKIL